MAETEKGKVTPINQRITNVDAFLNDIDGGAFKNKLGLLLSDIAAGAADYNKTGVVNIKIEVKKVEGSDDIMKVSHDLSHKTPKMYGFSSENVKKDTTFYIGSGGKLTILPTKDNADLFPND